MRPLDTQAKKDGLKLYFFPRTRSVRARWMLEEIGLSYELSLIDLRVGAHKSADYLGVHPLGKVPALSVDGLVLFESLAICLYLADRHMDAGLAPGHDDPFGRGEYYKWMAFSVATMEPAVLNRLQADKRSDGGFEQGAYDPAQTPFETAATYLDQTLAGRPFLLGERFSAADVMNGTVMMLASRAGLLGDYPSIGNWLAVLKSRPGYRRAASCKLKGKR